MSEENESPYLTVAEIARKTRLSKMTIYREVSAGSLPHIRINRSIRVHRDDLADYLSVKETIPHV